MFCKQNSWDACKTRTQTFQVTLVTHWMKSHLASQHRVRVHIWFTLFVRCVFICQWSSGCKPWLRLLGCLCLTHAHANHFSLVLPYVINVLALQRFRLLCSSVFVCSFCSLFVPVVLLLFSLSPCSALSCFVFFFFGLWFLLWLVLSVVYVVVSWRFSFRVCFGFVFLCFLFLGM